MTTGGRERDREREREIESGSYMDITIWEIKKSDKRNVR